MFLTIHFTMNRKVAAVCSSIAMVVGIVVIVVEVSEPARGTVLYVGGVGPGNYSKIQDAINESIDGDTVFVFSGTYYENVVIDKKIKLTGDDYVTTIIDGKGSGAVVMITSNWVNVTGFTIKGGGYIGTRVGLYLYNAQNCTIYDNNISWPDNLAMHLLNSNGNIVTNNCLSNSWTGIYLEASNNNTIRMNYLTNNRYGIGLEYSSYNDIIENTAINNFRAIINWWSDGNTIVHNNASSNLLYGISIEYSKGVIISDNKVIGNSTQYFGIGVYSSLEIELTNNILIGNGIMVEGNSVENWETHTISLSNSVNGKAIYYFKGQSGVTIPYDAGQIILANCTNITIENQELSNCSAGIQLGYSSYNKISENCISYNPHVGVLLFHSNGNTISDSNIFEFNKVGIELWYSNSTIISSNNITVNDEGINIHSSWANKISNNNILFNNYGIRLRYGGDNAVFSNNVSSNQDGISLSYSTHNNLSSNEVLFNEKRGIILEPYSFNNTIMTNSILSNNWTGIYFGRADYNNIFNNTICLSNQAGLRIRFSSHSNIINNNISLNKEGIQFYGSNNNNIASNHVISNIYGLNLYYTSSNNEIIQNTIINGGVGIVISSPSSYNVIYHNNFINNSNQVFDDTNLYNIWDNGYPSGGNYWSNYGGVDILKGPNQDIPGSDIIGDTPFIHNWGGHIIQDNYPLMEPFQPRDNYLVLTQEWNLISLPLMQIEQNLTRVLGTIDGCYDAVQWYDTQDFNDPWKHRKVGKPEGNDLFNLKETMGFWVHITEPGDTIFLYNGSQPTSNQTIQLLKGWNMVGYPSLTSRNRTAALNNLEFGIEVDAIWSHNAAVQKWEETGEFDSFFLGKGYWIHATQNCLWEVPL